MKMAWPATAGKAPFRYAPLRFPRLINQDYFIRMCERSLTLPVVRRRWKSVAGSQKLGDKTDSPEKLPIL
jgi:hypothetical protein